MTKIKVSFICIATVVFISLIYNESEAFMYKSTFRQESSDAYFFSENGFNDIQVSKIKKKLDEVKEDILNESHRGYKFDISYDTLGPNTIRISYSFVYKYYERFSVLELGFTNEDAYFRNVIHNVIMNNKTWISKEFNELSKLTDTTLTTRN